MRMRILAEAAAVVLLSNVAWAQDGLRSASLPERTLAAPLPTAIPDQFRAGPDTYTYRSDRRVHLDRQWQPRLSSGFGFFPWGYTWDGGADLVRSAEPVTLPRDDRRAGAADPPTPPTPPRERPLPKALGPGARKTFYVIPGCYAGDRPPRSDQLRPGCEASKIVEIPPAG